MPEVILSICIPTYNRAKNLDDSLISIVQQKRFLETDDVEIIISDNCSEDTTRQISEKYSALYKEKIRYFRNDENIGDANFEKVLSYGKGQYLKLNNDTLIHNENSLDQLIEIIKANAGTKKIILFPNGLLKSKNEVFCCNDLNSFVKNVSYWSTWIGCFGIWKDDFNLIHDFNRNAVLHLVQIDVLFRLISSGRSVLIVNSCFFNSVYPVSKGGYNLYDVFVTNYIGILEEYQKKNQISSVTLFNEKTKLMIYFLVPRTIQLLTKRDLYGFSYNKALTTVLNKYKFHPVLLVVLFYLPLRILLHYFKILIKSL